MDKINLAYFDNIFGKTEQNIVFASDRYTDMQLRFEEQGLASGFVHAISTPTMQLTELSVHADRPVQLVNDPTEAAESVFVLEGGAESRLENISTTLKFEKQQHNLQYNNEFGGNHTISSHFHALAITYDLGFLNELFQSDDSRSIGQLANAVHQRKTYLASKISLPTGGRVAEVVSAIRQCRFAGATRYLFLESKMMELLVLQMEQAQAAADSKSDNSWSVTDREKLHAIYNYIESAYLEVFSLKDLTRQFGLNEFKLKKGYKQLFQTTVFGHVHQLRMKKAQMLLQDNIMTVSEASFFIGYNNVSSFCTGFKKQFGYSPGKYRLFPDTTIKVA